MASGDFSVAAKLDSDGRIRGSEGTYFFFPPECTTASEEGNSSSARCIKLYLSEEYKGHDGRAADIWALGVTMWCLLFGEVPFYSSNMVVRFQADCVEQLCCRIYLIASRERNSYIRPECF